MIAGKQEVGGAATTHRLGGVGGLAQTVFHHAPQLAETFAGQFGEELFARFEVPIKGRLAHARGAADFHQLEAARPALAHQRQGRIHQGALEIAMVVGTRALLQDRLGRSGTRRIDRARRGRKFFRSHVDKLNIAR